LEIKRRIIMYRINWKNEFLPFALILIMFLAGIIFYPSLPDQIPVHWNIKGEANNCISKNVFSALLYPILTFGIWLLLLYIPFIDPRKEKYAQFENAFRTMRLVFIGLFAYLYGVMIANSLGASIPVEKAIPGGISVLFIFLGNLMGKIRQNYFIGIRLPWTLANQDVWNKTHRFAGKLLVGAGFLGLLGILLPPVWTAILLFGGICLAFTVAGIYSYVIFKKIQ
jgi:uncharacterized membrane protein